MRFLYNDSYHTGLSMTLCKVLCDDHTGCLGIGQDQTSMSLWISNHEKYDRKVSIICDGLVTAKGLLEDCVALFSRRIMELGFEIVILKVF